MVPPLPSTPPSLDSSRWAEMMGRPKIQSTASVKTKSSLNCTGHVTSVLLAGRALFDWRGRCTLTRSGSADVGRLWQTKRISGAALNRRSQLKSSSPVNLHLSNPRTCGQPGVADWKKSITALLSIHGRQLSLRIDYGKQGSSIRWKEEAARGCLRPLSLDFGIDVDQVIGQVKSP